MSRREPPVSILNPAFRYTPAANTDLRRRFKQMGFRPPSEQRVIVLPVRKAP